LRDIEVCLAAQAGKLYHMGIGAVVARSTLADANESRDWRIYFELAQRLIIKARALYVDEDFGENWPTLCMPSMPRPSICACRCSLGRRFAPPRRPKGTKKYCPTCALDRDRDTVEAYAG
jgi:hypothetical protein